VTLPLCADTIECAIVCLTARTGPRHRIWMIKNCWLRIGIIVVAAAGTFVLAIIIRSYIPNPAAIRVPVDATAKAPAALTAEAASMQIAASEPESAVDSDSPEEQKAEGKDANGIPSDIRQRVFEDFGTDRGDDIYLYLLTRIPEGLPNGTRPRHLRCILYLAKRDETQLDRYIEMCLQDTRDVMLQAEYEVDSGSRLVRKRDFARPFDEADLPQ
jgi:hypothetical protein